MSPTLPPVTKQPPCFPRVSGDEPTYMIDTNADTEFSPRERG